MRNVIGAAYARDSKRRSVERMIPQLNEAEREAQRLRVVAQMRARDGKSSAEQVQIAARRAIIANMRAGLPAMDIA